MVGAAVAATVPVWPGVQPGDPVADELLAPAEVALMVPIVLAFPLAWALLGRSRRVGVGAAAILCGCVLCWSVGTLDLGSYASPPTVDDWLRGYLVVAAGVTVAATVLDWRTPAGPPWPVQAVGVALWVAGLGLTVAVPVVGGAPMPPRDALLPLPPATAVADERAVCESSCVRTFTLVATDGAAGPELARRVGAHLADAKGWTVTWYGFSPDPDIACRPAGWLANPYRLCVSLRVTEASTVECRLVYANAHDPVY
jgi:hypothetical protein